MRVFHSKHATGFSPFLFFLLVSGLSTMPFKAFAQANYGLAFDGNDDYLNLGTINTPGNFSTGFTFECWVYWKQASDWSRLLDIGNGPYSDNIVVSELGSSNSLTLHVHIGNGYATEINVDGIIMLNTWMHVAVTITNTGYATIYINGRWAKDGQVPIPVNTSRNSCYIGRSNWTGNGYLNANMDEVRLYNTALSQSEIQAWMYKEMTPSHPKYANLVSYYSLNDGASASTMAADSKGVNNGTLYGFASTAAAINSNKSSGWIFSTVPRPTSQNKALNFDGIDDYVSLYPSAVNNLTQGTIETWVYLNTVNEEPILSKQFDNVNTYSLLTIGYYHSINHSPQSGDSGRIYFHPRNDLNLSSTTVLTRKQWYHIAVAFSTSGATIYINGIASGSASGDFTIPNDASSGNNTKLGSWSRQGYLDGILDQFRIWNVAKTQQQIRDGMHSAFPTATANLILNYTMNCTDSSSQIIDNSASLLNGVLGNVPNRPVFVSSPVVIDSSSQAQCSQAALSFDGVDDYVRADVPTTNNYTLETWVKVLDARNSSIIVATNNSGPLSSWSNQLRINNGKFEHFLNDGSPHTTTGTTTLIPGKWYHAAITASQGGRIRLYVNGIEEGTSSAIGTPWTGTQFQFGSASFGFASIKGVLEEVRMWNTELTQIEIKTWKDSVRLLNHPKYGNLTHHWKMEEGTGFVTGDATGSVNASLVNMSASSWISSNSPISCTPDLLVPQTISFAPLSDKLFGDTAFQISATASSGLPVTLTVTSGPATIGANNFITLIGAGSVTIEAKQIGDSNYKAATPMPQTFTVHKATQSIAFTADSSGSGYVLNATSSVGLPVSFSVSGYGSVAGNFLSFTGSGLVKVTAFSSGNQNYDTASASITFCVPATQPGPITGYQTVCPGSQSYEIATLPGVSYNWSVTGNHTVTASGNTATVNWTNTLGPCTLTVETYTACDATRKSSSLAVTVVNNSLPGQATNLYPDSTAVITSFPFALSWQLPANAQFYDVYIWKAGLPQPPTPAVANITQIGTAVYANQIPNLTPGANYNWQVVSKNGCGSTGSAVNRFAVSDLPNLKVKKVDVAPSAFAGNEIEVQFEVQNTGNADTRNAQWSDVVYYSTDASDNSAGVISLGGSGNIKALAPGESYQNTLRVRLPYTAVGKRYILVRTNAYNTALGETTMTDNLGFDTITVYEPQVPDLKLVPPVTVTPAIPFSGQDIRIHYTVKDTGMTPAQGINWKDYVYISPDSGLTLNNINTAILIGRIARNDLLPINTSYTVDTTVRLPVRLYGTIYLYVLTNAESSFYETFRVNNLARTDTVTVKLKPPPDFVAASITIPSTAASGETVAVSYSVKNAGASAPNPTETIWRDGLFISKDSVFNWQRATLLKTFSPSPIPSMNIGESYNNVVNVTIPDSFRDSAWMFVFTDVNNDVFEYNKDTVNNFAGRKIKINNPDLRIDTIKMVDSALAGTTVNVEYRVRNAGPGKALPIVRKDQVWLSSSPVYNPANRTLLIAPAVANALDTGASIPLSVAVPIPATVTDSIVYLYIEADNTGQIPETDETNNRFRSAPLKITLVAYPDLAASGMQVSATALLTDHNYAIQYTVTNNGPADVIAGTWRDKIFFSPDSVWNSATAKEIKALPQSMTLFGGASYTVTDSVSLDLAKLNGQDSGRFYLYVFADAQSAITETVPDDNNRSRTGPVTLTHEPFPDLLVTKATATDSANAGSRIAVTYRVKNAGGVYGFSGHWLDRVYFSPDSLRNDNDVPAATKMITSPLAADGSYELTLYVTVPNGLSGAYYLLVVTDADEVNKDNNRANNTRVASITVNNQPTTGPVYVTPTSPSDLLPVILQAPSFVTAGQPFTVKWTILNQQHITAKPAWVEKIVLSTDDVVDDRDPVLSIYPHTGSLDSNRSYTDSVQVFAPANVSGNFKLLLKTNFSGSVYESNTTNNTKSSILFMAQPKPSDLIVSDVSVPDSAIIGDSLVVRWAVMNAGSNPATGYIRQGIYLDSGTAWMAASTLLYTQGYQINLPPLATDTFFQKVKLKGVNAGRQHAVVRTDLLNNIPESNEQNNDAASTQAVTITVPRLLLNDTLYTVLQNNDERYYRLEIPDSLEGGAVLVSLHGRPQSTNELYVRFGQVPTRVSYDYGFDRAASDSQAIVIPNLKKGTYYILVYGQSVSGPQNIRLLAREIPFEIRTVAAAEGGNTGLVTVRLDGARFEEGMKAVLYNATDTVTAQKVQWLNSTALYATFNLTGTRPGRYTTKLTTLDNRSALRPASFTVVQGSGSVVNNGSGSGNGFYCRITTHQLDLPLDVLVDYPPSVRTWRIFATTFHYGNAGNVNIPIPVRILTCLQSLPVSADATEIYKVLAQVAGGQVGEELLETLLQFDESGVADFLRPGYKGSKTIFSVIPFDNPYTYRLIEK